MFDGLEGDCSDATCVPFTQGASAGTTWIHESDLIISQCGIVNGDTIPPGDAPFFVPSGYHNVISMMVTCVTRVIRSHHQAMFCFDMFYCVLNS